jgi:hypothetical protein
MDLMLQLAVIKPAQWLWQLHKWHFKIFHPSLKIVDGLTVALTALRQKIN